MWTSPAQVPFMAVTAHYIIEVAGRLELRARLVAFRQIDGEHSGLNMAHNMARILFELKVLHKVCLIFFAVPSAYLFILAWTIHSR
jgi:hypothetical protein